MRVLPKDGLQIDGFTLGQCLHRGGFATIWEVTHPDHRGEMVMKVPTILDGYDAPTIVGFEVEQMIMPRLSGPHVPKVVAVGEFDVMPYIVTEKIPGGSMFERFRSAPLPVGDVIEYAARMAAAVNELHRQHVTHLDLKPGNFMQRPSGEMVAIDFGLSRHDELPDLLAEEFTIPMGTYPYISPEQYLRSREDPRSDIFALGAMIYELATGRMPWGEPRTLRQVRRRLWRDPVPPRAIRPEIPEWLQEIILKALEVDPILRYQTAGQLAFDLMNPAQVVITGRGRRTEPDGFWRVLRRWRTMRKVRSYAVASRTADMAARAPILMVAVDLSPEQEALSARLLSAVGRMLVILPEARVACVNILRTARIALDSGTDEDGNNLHVSRLVALKAWGEGLKLPEERLTFTVLESADPATAIIDYADQNHVEHILMGARGHSTARRYLGSVSARVVSEAPCSVTVIRIPDDRADLAGIGLSEAAREAVAQEAG